MEQRLHMWPCKDMCRWPAQFTVVQPSISICMAKGHCRPKLVPAVGHGTEQLRMKEFFVKKKSWRWWGAQSPANTIDSVFWTPSSWHFVDIFQLSMFTKNGRVEKNIARCSWTCWLRQGPRTPVQPRFPHLFLWFSRFMMSYDARCFPGIKQTQANRNEFMARGACAGKCTARRVRTGTNCMHNTCSLWNSPCILTYVCDSVCDIL